MALTLQLVFKKSDGKDFVLTVDEPRPGITPTEVQTAMEQIIASGVFKKDGDVLTAVKSARIIDRSTNDLISSK
ncbi:MULTISPECIES: DUF2922 domain-containing protein [Sporosarcina]|uniref:DUF2922 domain-containing protein n=1 Tax=Sporosarcina TaxID=1569 RepID=UPI000579BA61|nr:MULTISPECIES: DUF2922 domain-containing protein [Sporosarcina]MCM3757220.1 DUF2922 domain-containing protein [Sporosarcina aquimarina]VDG98673.1 Protein of uncharacterised function (DUF2922) [Lysinibacillus sphaericus]